MWITLSVSQMEALEFWNVRPAITMQKTMADDGIPENYVLQVRHYLAVMNMNKAYIACLMETMK